MTRSMHELPWILVLSLTLGVESVEKLPILGRTLYMPKGRHQKQNLLFLGNSPKQRTPPTHRYGLGLT